MKCKCDRCGAKFSAPSELELEIKFNEHECKGKRKLSDLPLHLLRELAYKRITEAQAWERFDKGETK